MKNEKLFYGLLLVFVLALAAIGISMYMQTEKSPCEYCIKTGTGEKLSFTEARKIASESVCVKEGRLKDTYFCNNMTGTWWFDMDVKKEGCNPACVVDVSTKQAEINWRCTGLISKEQACINSGGKVETGLCCKSAEDFPNLCLIGACGCSPGNSHEVKICNCAEGGCFDGNKCVKSAACTEEAKLCPDGTAVGRTGPDCEFAPCPGEAMTIADAVKIAKQSECTEKGSLKDEYTYNNYSKTWWIDLDMKPEFRKDYCSPACVVSEETGTAEINWRCTGALPPNPPGAVIYSESSNF